MFFYCCFLSCFLFFWAEWQCHPDEPVPGCLKQADCFGCAGSSCSHVGLGAGGLLGQLFILLGSNRTSDVRLLLCPILQKNQFAALARLVLVMCGAESCSCYGVLPVFYFYCVYNKAFAVPSLVCRYKSMG